MVSASEEEENYERPPPRTRKQTEKARQNERNYDALDAALMGTKRQLGGGSQAGAAGRAVAGRTKDAGGATEPASIATLQKLVSDQTKVMVALLESNKELLESNKELHEKITKLEGELCAANERLQAVEVQLGDMAAIAISQNSASPSYADVARTPPGSVPSNVRTLSSWNTLQSNVTDTLYCTVDTSSVERETSDSASAGAIRSIVERRMRAEKDNSTWRCRAVTKDPKNPHRIRIACRDEAEHEQVKRVVGANLAPGTRVLRDDIYPIRVDSVNRVAVLDENGEIRAGAAEAIGRENDTQIAKIAWLSNRNNAKAYGSMVVYLNKGRDAQRFIQEGFFTAGGESGYTKAFERRERPKQCYNCQEITDHKAYQCKRTQVCGRCAKEGHRHSECTEAIPKCVPCGGPHESFSRSCRKLYPSRHE